MKKVPSFCKYCSDNFYNKGDKESIFNTSACTWCYRIGDMIKEKMASMEEVVKNDLTDYK